MININERILSAVTGDELITLCHIAKRINRKSSAFPSVETLRKETGFGREKMEKIIRSLCKKGIMSKQQRKAARGKFSSNLYTITTEDISVFVSINGAQVKETPYAEKPATVEPITETPCTDFPATAEPCTENPATKYYNSSEVLSSSEVLNTLTPRKKIENPELSQTTETAKILPAITPPVPPAPPVNLEEQILQEIQKKTCANESRKELWRMQARPVLSEEEMHKHIRAYARGWMEKHGIGKSDEELLTLVKSTSASGIQSYFERAWLPNINRRTGDIRTNKPEPKKYRWV